MPKSKSGQWDAQSRTDGQRAKRIGTRRTKTFKPPLRPLSEPEYSIHCTLLCYGHGEIAKISLPDDRNKYNIIYITVCN